MAKINNSFDEFLKKVIARDSHPIYNSFLSKARIYKIFLIDSIIAGSLFGLYALFIEMKFKPLTKSLKLGVSYAALALLPLFLSSLLN